MGRKTSAGLDLCTKKRWRGACGTPVCYKTRSARKLLIFQGLGACTFFARRRQILDFSGLRGCAAMDFNKVIHMQGTNEANGR
jgi:hypothetical protein